MIYYRAYQTATNWVRLVRLVGLLELAGAAILLALGSERLQRFVEWWLSRTPLFVRYWCVVALAFGVLIACAGACGQ